MTLTLVPRPARLDQLPRLGAWARISISLMLCGVLALVTAAVIGLNWFYGLHRLIPTGVIDARSVAVNEPFLVDELVASRGGSAIVDLRSVAVRLTANTAGATAVIETCAGSASVTLCDSPKPFSAGPMDLTARRIVVVVRAVRAGTVEVDGVEIAYRDGVRAAKQHVGPTLTLTVR